MTETIKWANSWFLDLTGKVLPPDEQPRPWLFIVAAGLLSWGLETKKDLKTIHNWFTFLLRGWNPLTAEVNASVGEPPEDQEDVVFTESYNEAVKSLMDFEQPPSRSAVNQLLSAFALTARKVGSRTQTPYMEERKTLQILSLWLLTRQYDSYIPDDIHVVRECLRIYKLSNSKPAGDMMPEYCGGSSVFGWHEWLLKNATYLLESDKPTSQVLSDIVYLAVFISLIRATRCIANARGSTVEEAARVSEARISLESSLDAEVDTLREYQENYKMRLEVPRKASRFINVFGIKPKKQPPIVNKGIIGSN